MEATESYEPDDLLARIARLQAVTWEWRDEDAVRSRGLDPGSRALGVIAQEAEAVFPELVRIDDEGVRHVDYHGLAAVLLEAVKALDARVRALEASRQGS